jgi:hypothetical protein
MKGVELYGQVRRAGYVEGRSRREAARRFGIDPRTVAKMLAFPTKRVTSGPRASVRSLWCATGATITRCRPLTATAKCWSEVTSTKL